MTSSSINQVHASWMNVQEARITAPTARSASIFWKGLNAPAAQASTVLQLGFTLTAKTLMSALKQACVVSIQHAQTHQARTLRGPCAKHAPSAPAQIIWVEKGVASLLRSSQPQRRRVRDESSHTMREPCADHARITRRAHLRNSWAVRRGDKPAPLVATST